MLTCLDQKSLFLNGHHRPGAHSTVIVSNCKKLFSIHKWKRVVVGNGCKKFIISASPHRAGEGCTSHLPHHPRHPRRPPIQIPRHDDAIVEGHAHRIPGCIQSWCSNQVQFYWYSAPNLLRVTIEDGRNYYKKLWEFVATDIYRWITGYLPL